MQTNVRAIAGCRSSIVGKASDRGAVVRAASVAFGPGLSLSPLRQRKELKEICGNRMSRRRLQLRPGTSAFCDASRGSQR